MPPAPVSVRGYNNGRELVDSWVRTPMSENAISVDANELVDTPTLGIVLIVVGISVFSV